MSDDQVNQQEAAAPTVEFAPENQAPAATTEPAQPIKTDVDELVEIFSQHPSKDAALQAMKSGSVGEGKDKRFSANGKTYSVANCRKAINRIEEKGLFKGQVQQQEAKEGTFKEDAPAVNQRAAPPADDQIGSQVIDDPHGETGGQPITPPVAPPPAIEPPTPGPSIETLEAVSALLDVDMLADLAVIATENLADVCNRKGLAKSRDKCIILAKLWKPVISKRAPKIAQSPEGAAILGTLAIFSGDIMKEAAPIVMKLLRPKQKQQGAAA